MQQIIKSEQALEKIYIKNPLSDVHGGVSLDISTLVAGNVVAQASPVTAPSSGLRKICKQAQILAGSTTTAFVVNTSTNQFKVGDILFQVVGGAAYAISTVVDNGDGTTTLTVGTALESAAAGTWIYQSSVAAGEGAATGALENDADAIQKFAFEVPSTSQVIFTGDVLLRADVLENAIGPLYLAQLKGVIEMKY